MIDDVHIPGSMSVIAPQYAIGRSKSFWKESNLGPISALQFANDNFFFFFVTDEAVYAEANSFIPERWYQFPDMIKNKDAFAPFSTGKLHTHDENNPGSSLICCVLRSLWLYSEAHGTHGYSPGDCEARMDI